MDMLGVPSVVLEFALTAANDINTRAQNITVHRRQCMQLAKRCAELVGSLREQESSLEGSKLRDAVDEMEEVLVRIRKRVIEWANLNRVKSFMRQDQIAADLETFNGLLDTHVLKFQIVSTIELNRQQRRMDLDRQNDQEEVKEMLHQLIRNVDDLSAAVGMRDDVPALMQTIQEELTDEQPGTEDYQALRGGLDTLHTKTGILPPLTNLTGQVTKLSDHPAAEGGTADIYEGKWVGDEKVMLKAIRRVESDSAVRRFHREVDIWRRLQHMNILRFYGVCQIGPRLFAVAPWAEGGNLQVYIRNHHDCDRMRLLSEVALGLKYLHTFKPMIVHGDLRAANVVVSATGEALLADFGLSKIIAEEEGAVVASTSLANAGSSRWMAPELFQPEGNSTSGVTSASDVWSFGMLCLEVLTGYAPFYHRARIDAQVIALLITKTLPERPTPREDMHSRGLSDEMWQLMQRCWAWEASARPEMRSLASEVRKLHTEHLKRFGVSSLGGGNNLGSVDGGVGYGASLFGGSVWGSTAHINLIPTPPATNSSASVRGFNTGTFNDSPRTINSELPPVSPTSPYPESYHSFPGAAAMPGRGSQDTMIGQFRGMHLGTSEGSSAGLSIHQFPRTDATPMSNNVNRSPTIRAVPGFRRYSATSRASDIAVPHPEGEPLLKCDDNGYVLAGNLEGLVERLLQTSLAAKMDKEFRECFLTVYRGFAKVETLWPMLVTQYRDMYAASSDRDRTKLQVNMLAILNDWLVIQAIQPKDTNFLLDMQEFINSAWPNELSNTELERLNTQIKAHLIVLSQYDARSYTGAGARNIKLADLEPPVVAKQLMRIESDLFQKILASDCAAWVKNIEDEELINIRRFFKNNYKIEDWCLHLILFIDAKDIERRAHVIIFLKRIAEECLNIRAFSSAHAIMSALTHAHINGLEYTWRLVDKRTKESLKQMSLLFSDAEKYKAALDSDLQMPSVPILRIHLRDLSRSYKEMETWVRVGGDELINFAKFTEVWKSIKDLMKYQTPKHEIPTEPITAGYLEHMFTQIEDNSKLQEELKTRGEELQKRERRDFSNRRLGMEDAGFRPPKKR